MGVQNVVLTDKGFETTAFIIAGIFILIFLGKTFYMQIKSLILNFYLLFFDQFLLFTN
jgi:hypothetical protein